MIFNKQKIVQNIFEKVPDYYNMMNDVMSFGLHRIWKTIFMQLSEIMPHHQVLDLACGTGDIALKIAKKLNNTNTQLYLADPSFEMLSQAESRMLNNGYIANYIQAEAEHLPFEKNTFDRISIAFGFRNFYNQTQALDELYRVLKPSGKLVILEFSHPKHFTIEKLYAIYRDYIIPKMGSILAKDEQSYQYLADSIADHPNQNTLEQMIKDAGFIHTDHTNLLDGIAAIHYGHK